MAVRINPDGSITVGILKDEPKEKSKPTEKPKKETSKGKKK